MSEAVEKKEEKPKATSKAAPKKAAAPKAAAVKKAPGKARAPKARKTAGDKGTVTVTQVIGTIARQKDQLATLKGLGLGKRHRTRTLEDTPSVRGMIYKVRHLVKVEG